MSEFDPSELDASARHSRLRRRGDGLWTAEHPLRVMGVPFGMRTSFVRLPDGTLLVHSPGSWDPVLVAEVAELGRVSCIVAPNKLHHLHFAETSERFPDAERWLAPGLAERRPQLPAGRTLGAVAPPSWRGALEIQHVAGLPLLEETAFWHRASRSLLLTDLAFHLPRGANVWERSFLRIAGAHDRFGPSRSVRWSTRDRSRLRASVDRILEWEFDRVVVAHGGVLESGGRQAVRSAFAWLG